MPKAKTFKTASQQLTHCHYASHIDAELVERMAQQTSLYLNRCDYNYIKCKLINLLFQL